MAGNLPFGLVGKTVSLKTNTVANTSTSRQLTPSDFGLNYFPSQMRIVNRGTVDIWFSITAATATAVIPTAGTTTSGTPQPTFIILPGIIEVFSLPLPGTTLPGAAASLWINDIATDVSQTYHICLGEGL